LIQLIFVNYFLLEACSHKICFKAGNRKPVERKWFATAPTTVREVAWGFARVHLNVGLTSRFDNAIHSRQTPLTRRKPLKRETCHNLSTEQVNKRGISPPKAPRGDWTVWQNFSLLFDAIDLEKYLD